MSAYESDPRVVFNQDGTVTLPGGANGDWTVHERDGFWTADNPEQGFLRSSHNGAFQATFHTRDEVLERLLGPAQVTA